MEYDVIIVGGGPAGFAAGIYAARFNLKTLIVIKEIGGALAGSYDVENYMGFKSISGLDLINKFKEQAESLGVTIKYDTVKNIKKIGEFKFQVDEHTAKAVILCTGSTRRKLNIPGEDQFSGKGVSYCATCDAAFFRNKKVCVIGGSDGAGLASLLLSEYANEVYIIYRGPEIHPEPITKTKILRNPKIKIITSTNVKEIYGEKMVKGIVLDKPYQGSPKMELQGLFVEVGATPANELAKQLNAQLNERGKIIVKNDQRTNIKGVYAAGDITTATNEFEQAITACAQGSIAAASCYEDLSNQQTQRY
ncbi:FAD-dependent oxidoreductase [Candidatus Woesearchaeota archaeon]|nr:FAD-dependent oxidoreductase [Candidatus Woesearchaeota archaeon]